MDAERDPRFYDIAWLAEQMQTRTIVDIAAELKCHHTTLRIQLAREGLRPHCHCIYCGKEYASKHIYTHQRVCACNPTVAPLARRTLDDGTGAIVCRNRYRQLYPEVDAPSESTLTDQLGSWPDVAAFFGLSTDRSADVAPRPPRLHRTLQRSETDEIFAQVDAEIAAQLRMDKAALAAAREYAPFEACRSWETNGEVHYLLR